MNTIYLFGIYLHYKIQYIMPYANLSIALDETKRQNLINSIANLQTKMNFLVQLTTKEKKAHYRLGKKAPVFFNKAIELARQNPTLVPPYFNQAEFEQDVQDHQYMSDILVQITQLQTAIQHTVIALEQESVRAALNFYKLCQTASTQNFVGAQEAVAQLKPLMNKTGKHKKKTDEK